MFLTYALRKTFFRLSLKKAKVVPLPKSTDKTNPTKSEVSGVVILDLKKAFDLVISIFY